MPSLTALFVGLGSIGTRHLNNLAELCAQRGLTLRADALRSDPARPLRPGAAELLHAQFTALDDPAAHAPGTTWLHHQPHQPARRRAETAARAGRGAVY